MKHHQVPKELPLASRAVPFDQFLEKGEIPQEYMASDYIAHQFVERLVHYVVSVPAGSFKMSQLIALLEQLDPRHQIYFFKKLKETSPESLKHFKQLYYGFMAEFHALLFT